MSEQIDGDLYIQTFMIVWDVKLKIIQIHKQYDVDILTPPFSLDSTKSVNTNWIRLIARNDALVIRSNFSSKKEFKECTTYMIDPSTNTVLDDYNGFNSFYRNQDEWNEKMRFVFELKIQTDTSAVQPIIWKRCTTEIKPPINTNGLLLNLDSEISTHTVLNNQGVSCAVKRYRGINSKLPYDLDIIPENTADNWNLLTVMLRKKKNNVLIWDYLHTGKHGHIGICNSEFEPTIIFEINELLTSLENMSEFDIVAIKNIIKPLLTPATIKKELSQLNITPNLMEYFVADKFCDITVQVGDQKIRAHKVVLATGSPIWHNFFYEDVTIDSILIKDFDYVTMKQLIEFMYTGIVKQPMLAADQLLMAADKYGSHGLKELCEEQLIETIEMKTVVNLLVLSDQCRADNLFNKVLVYVRENYAEFTKLDEAETIFMIYPKLAFKLFARIM